MKTCLLAMMILASSLSQAGAGSQQPGGAPPHPQARKIPGINAEDSFPHACVDCHVKRPEMDVRFSTLLGQWKTRVDSRVLAKAQASAPEGLVLKGKHPDIFASLKEIPSGCLQCHARDSKMAPPFSAMIHRIHLTGGEENHFMTLFQGECTYCHKLDQTTGRWGIPSAAEK
jgi:hypothetical protein